MLRRPKRSQDRDQCCRRVRPVRNTSGTKAVGVYGHVSLTEIIDGDSKERQLKTQLEDHKGLEPQQVARIAHKRIVECGHFEFSQINKELRKERERDNCLCIQADGKDNVREKESQ